MSASTEIANPVKARMAAGDVALGMILRLTRSGEGARIARATGHDFVFIDVQHAPYNLETIGHIATTALGIGIAPLVRVRGVDDPDVSIHLDAGALGIVFPDVNTPEEARRAVDKARFAPVGKRSVGASYPQFDCRGVSAGEAVARLEPATLVVAMIETREGLDNVDAIAQVEGIDVVHVGSNDLLANMGLAGQFDHPALIEAQDRVIAAARGAGKFAGCGGNRDVERQAAAIRRGAQFVTTQTDIGFLMAAAGQWTGGVRKLLAG
jgi:2-keto-3-deoxy-L-rhamnonate aldolase RhmA